MKTKVSKLNQELNRQSATLAKKEAKLKAIKSARRRAFYGKKHEVWELQLCIIRPKFGNRYTNVERETEVAYLVPQDKLYQQMEKLAEYLALAEKLPMKKFAEVQTLKNGNKELVIYEGHKDNAPSYYPKHKYYILAIKHQLLEAR